MSTNEMACEPVSTQPSSSARPFSERDKNTSYKTRKSSRSDKIRVKMPLQTTTLPAQFYLVRPNGVATPLIAVDELPKNILIDGVPRRLSIDDIDRMSRMPGKFEARPMVHKIVDTGYSSAAESTSQAECGFGFPKTKAIFKSDKALEPNAKEFLPGSTKSFGINEEASKSEPKDVSATPTPNKPEAAFNKFEPLPDWKDINMIGYRPALKGKKIFCSHWLSTGECDYAQQGCLYKHEMPFDTGTLQYLGFRDIPKWYRERHGIGKLTAVPGSGAHIKGSALSTSLPQGNWRSLANAARQPRASDTVSTKSRLAFDPQGRGPIVMPNAHPVHRNSKNLLDLESRPATPLSMNIAKPKTSLLDSKFATLQPYSTVSDSGESTTSKSEERSESDPSSRSSSEPVGGSSFVDASNSETSDTSVEFLPVAMRSARAGHNVTERPQRKWQDFAEHARMASKISEATNDHEVSRRSSLATDYEASLFREQREHDDHEAQLYAEIAARTQIQREETRLERMQEETLLKAKEDLGSSRISSQVLRRRSAIKTDSVKKGAKKNRSKMVEVTKSVMP